MAYPSRTRRWQPHASTDLVVLATPARRTSPLAICARKDRITSIEPQERA